MLNRKPILIVLISSIFSLTSVLAQNKKDSLQFNLKMDLSSRRISGTFKQLVAGGGLELKLRYGNWQLKNNTNYRYNKTNAILIENNWYDLLRLMYYPYSHEKLYFGFFYHYDNNLLYRINSRHQYGTGIGSTLDKGLSKLSLIATIGYERSDYRGSEFVNSNRDFSIRENGLFLFRLDHGIRFPKYGVSISSRLFYFQSLAEGADYDLWINSSVRFKIWRGLSFNIIYDYRFENVHLEALSNDNDVLLFGFNLVVGSNAR